MRIVIAMSGGVDSSVAAALLLDQGHEVIGISMRLYDAEARANGKGCCSPADMDDARRASAVLGIPYYSFDMRESFQKNVIDDFVNEYTQGRTPNPCVRCNQHIKFDSLWDKAKRLGATAIATGHYARISEGEDGRLHLLRGVDRKKDQSYFLFPLTPEHLGRIQFPVGHLTKEEVRQIARERGLPNADKPESQEICFVNGGSYAEVVERLADKGRIKPGIIVDEQGRRLGEHAGVHLYTIGQRRGLPPSEAKRYVASIDPEKGVVQLGDGDSLLRRSFTCSPVRWPSGAPESAQRARVMIRYRHAGAEAEIRPTEKGAEVVLDLPERAVTPGQAAVFYDGERVLGGGWIC
jgi:tRNA-specific 2-thiouridylase